jgi:hypothetical protein
MLMGLHVYNVIAKGDVALSLVNVRAPSCSLRVMVCRFSLSLAEMGEKLVI